MYEFMFETVLTCTFMMIIAFDICAIVSIVKGFISWVKKRLHKEKKEETE